MQRLASGFSLTVFERRNAKSRQLAPYLVLYASNFGSEHRTKTNELVEFLQTPPDDRKIVYFGLDREGEPIGFAALMIYPEKNIGIIDYLVIAPNSRGHAAFFCFCDLIAAYIERQNLALEHLVAEVIVDERNVATTIKPAMLIRLMRVIGFKVARAAYWAPDPLISHDRDGCKAALMVASRPERKELTASHFMSIVDLVYRKHYGEWYRRAMQPREFQAYAAACEAARRDLEARVSRDGRVILNGVRDPEGAVLLDTAPRPDLPKIVYILLVALPATIGAAVAFKQEIYIAAWTAAVTLLVLAVGLLFPRLRRAFLRIFQLAE
jgi:hypothetical protein